MTTTPLDYAAPAAPDGLGEDWFGEGSVFDSGEQLASALLALAATARRAPASPRMGSAERPPRLPAAVPARMASPVGEPGPELADGSLELVGEFQVAAMPSFRARTPASPAPPRREPAGLQRSPAMPTRAPRAARSGWSIRQSVQMLRTTEEILRRLRDEAAELAWYLAAAASREVDG